MINQGPSFSLLSSRQLGRPSLQPGTFLPVPALHAYNVQSVSCGATHTLAADDAGCVFGWGAGGKGQLGPAHNNNEEEDPDGQCVAEPR